MRKTQKRYSSGYKAKLLARMSGPSGISARMLSKEAGVTQSTLSRWLRESIEQPLLEPVPNPGNRKKDWTLHEKVRVLAKADELSQDELGAYLRQEGIHPEVFKAWQESLDEARVDRSTKRRIKALERELRRKEKALAEAAALLLLKKKAIEFGLLDAEDYDTGDPSES